MTIFILYWNEAQLFVEYYWNNTQVEPVLSDRLNKSSTGRFLEVTR